MAAVENGGQGLPFMDFHLPDRLKKKKKKKDPRFQGKVNMHIVSSTGLRGKRMN